mmetsp:Transcript_24542/g.27546  ORF Transcript_24542/g.27546 Transcript_24542/m.27546 type:complete len:592 (+) Transcript_24542:9-1784(+)
MPSKEGLYSWHLSLRVDRPVEGCTMRPHAYMYGKKLDDRDMEKPLAPHSKKCREPPPDHEFSYRWFRGPRHEPCAYESCPRRTSFSPHDWSMHALGGSGCSLQCMSNQSSLNRCIFCNSRCFIEAWKTQKTVSIAGIEEAKGGIGATNGNGNSNSSTGGLSGGYPSGSSLNESVGETEGGGWTEVCRDQVYIPTADDTGRKLKLEAAAYSVETGELLMHRVVETDLVLSRAPDPAKRSLVAAKIGGGSGGARFRIVTYNVLAEIYATQQQYPYCDFWALSWDYRFQNILREILDVSPDVVCLQEVQADYYENQFYAAMSEAGYEGVYKQKTRQSMGLAGKVDGCALFWKRTKFHLVESYSIEFNELAQRHASQVLGMNPRSEDCVSYLNRLSKDNVAQLVVLELVQPSRSNRDLSQVCIANTHLYSNKDFPDVKLWQTWQLLQELENFVLSRGSSLPLMICGDFNSTPDTAVYDLLSHQAVHPGHPDVNVNTGDDGPNVLPDAISITHSFQLGSAYQSVMGEEPKQTNFTQLFKGVLDYMWYSSQNLRPLSAAPIPDEKVLLRNGTALPSTEYSSDHLMMISDMQIINNGP